MSMKFNYSGTRLAISIQNCVPNLHLEDKVKNLMLLSLGWHFLPCASAKRILHLWL